MTSEIRTKNPYPKLTLGMFRENRIELIFKSKDVIASCFNAPSAIVKSSGITVFYSTYISTN